MRSKRPTNISGSNQHISTSANLSLSKFVSNFSFDTINTNIKVKKIKILENVIFHQSLYSLSRNVTKSLVPHMEEFSLHLKRLELTIFREEEEEASRTSTKSNLYKFPLNIPLPIKWSLDTI